MIREESQGIPIYRFASLKQIKGIAHAVTTRQGGVSQAPFNSLNLARGQDDPAAVAQNLALVKEALGIERLAWARQVHGDKIMALNGDQDGEVGEADGLATGRPGVGLLIKQADCQAVVLAAPQRGVIANLHVGWRGNVVNMPGQGVAFLQEQYGVSPGELHAAVSPSLGPCCAQFVNHPTELGPDFVAYQTRPDYFDLWQVTRDQLVQAGVPGGQIELSGLCTRCGEEFFSYRRDKVTGRFGTLVAVRED